jgi:hypothetical protein
MRYEDILDMVHRGVLSESEASRIIIHERRRARRRRYVAAVEALATAVGLVLFLGVFLFLFTRAL